MDLNLLKVRVISFGYELLAMLLSGFVAILASDSFADLVNEHFGGSIIGMFLLLIASGVVKHLRNLRVLREYYERMGSGSVMASGDKPTII